MELLEADKKYEVIHSNGNFMNLEDLDACLEKLAWHKSPGKNNVSPNAVKVLELDLRIKLLKFLNEWLMNEDVVYLEWLIASLKVLPKKGDLKNPNNWRGIIHQHQIAKTSQNM